MGEAQGLRRRRGAEAADPAQGVGDHPGSQLGLQLSSDVLPGATAAAPLALRAGGLDPTRRGLEHPGHPGPRVVASALDQLDLGELARQTPIDQDHPAVAQTADPVTAGGDRRSEPDLDQLTHPSLRLK